MWAVARINDASGEWVLQGRLRTEHNGTIEIVAKTTSDEGRIPRIREALGSINWDDALWAIDEFRSATFDLERATVIVQRYTGSEWVL